MVYPPLWNPSAQNLVSGSGKDIPHFHPCMGKLNHPGRMNIYSFMLLPASSSYQKAEESKFKEGADTTKKLRKLRPADPSGRRSTGGTAEHHQSLRLYDPVQSAEFDAPSLSAPGQSLALSPCWKSPGDWKRWDSSIRSTPCCSCPLADSPVSPRLTA